MSRIFRLQDKSREVLAQERVEVEQRCVGWLLGKKGPSPSSVWDAFAWPHCELWVLEYVCGRWCCPGDSTGPRIYIGHCS